MSNHAERYRPHPHIPKNVRVIHAEERQSVNDKIAVFLTRTVGSMPMAYSFVVLAIVGLLAILGILTPLVALLVAWTSQTLIQLVLLPVIMVGQNVLNRHQEIQSDEEFKKTLKIFHDVELVLKQNTEQLELLDAQSKELAAHYQELTRQTHLLTDLLGKIGEGHQEMARQSAMLNVALTPRRRPMKQEVKSDD